MPKPSSRFTNFTNFLAGFRSWPLIAAALALSSLCVQMLPTHAAEPPAAPPLFQYKPPRVIIGGGASNNPGANSVVAAEANIGTASTPGMASSVNILILALDEADINAARITNIAPLVPATPNNAAKILDVAPAAADVDDIDEMMLPDAPAPRPGHAPANPALPAPGGNAGQPAVAILPETLQPIRRALVDDQAKPMVIAAPHNTIPALPSTPSTLPPDEGALEIPSRRPAGRAQYVAAPLRRALSAAGFRDVLTTPLDGASILRSLNNGRVTMRTLDALRFTTGQMLDAAQAGAARFTAEGVVMEKVPVPASPSPTLAQARQGAIAAAARIGLTLGYRAVVVVSVASAAQGERPGAVYSLLVVDAPRESGQAFLMRQEGAEQTTTDQAAASSAAQNIAAQLRNWPAFTNTDRATQVERYLTSARIALQKNDVATAQDQLQLVVAFDPSNSEGYILLGDALQNSDPVAAAKSYQRAVEINTQSGVVWSKIAMVHTLANPPDWVRALQAAKRAQQLGFDSANLRTVMAASEFGRADLFRRSGRIDQAEDAELVARRHLERARELAPDNPEVAASVSRLMAKYLLEQKRYKEAVQALDLLAIQYPNDLQTQRMYARALEGYGKRDEDTFLAWARVWKLSGESEVPLDATRYAVIADGFDQRLVNLGKNVFQLTYGVSTGAILRETALLQTGRAKEELKTVVDALRIMQAPPGKTSSEAHVSRLFASDLMLQALEFYSIYLETGNDLNRTRAVDTHRQAIESLNIARGASTQAGV